MTSHLFIYLFLFSFLSLSFSQTCQDLSSDETCTFYQTCLEDEYSCGPDGYPMGYGYKYCEKFLEYLNEFSDSGKLWIQKTLVCLKQTLLPLAGDPATTCQEIHDTAFDSHPKCYALNGFCELFFDPVHILENVKGLLQVYEIKDLSQPISIKQMVETAGLCGESVVQKFSDAIMRILEGEVESFLGNF
jgi:hypothetical protein